MKVLIAEGIGIVLLSSYWVGILFKNHLFNPYRTWHKLKFKNYKIDKKEKIDTGLKLKIKVLPGGSVEDFKKNIGAIEKAFGCTCVVEDREKSKYIDVILNTKKEEND